MSEMQYSKVKIKKQQATDILDELYDIKGQISELPGELDFNFKIRTTEKKYIFKISRPNVDKEFIDFQYFLLKHIEQSPVDIV